MSTPFPTNPFGASGKPGAGLWDVFEQLRSTFDPRASAPRKSRGDVRAAILALLAEEPMHGYQIIHEIEERSGGAWKPSPGSVYPTLQLLADEGLISAEELRGRKTYSLTETGREGVDAEGTPPWQTAAPQHDIHRHTALAKAGAELASATALVARTGGSEQTEQAVEILTDARRKLYALLSEA